MENDLRKLVGGQYSKFEDGKLDVTAQTGMIYVWRKSFEQVNAFFLEVNNYDVHVHSS